MVSQMGWFTPAKLHKRFSVFKLILPRFLGKSEKYSAIEDWVVGPFEQSLEIVHPIVTRSVSKRGNQLCPRLRFLKLRPSVNFAPKGPNKSAQGRAKWRFATSAALGYGIHNNAKALKGRNNVFEILFRPFRALPFGGFHQPRALPWADMSLPLRAENPRSATSKLTLH